MPTHHHQRRRPLGVTSDAVMSDRTLLVTVEDLIYMAFGPPERNTVNFKLLQTVLHILARHMRLLEQDVEIKIDEIISEFAGPETDESGTYSSSSAEGDELNKEVRSIEHKRKKAERERARKQEKGNKKKSGEKGEKEEPKSRRGKGEKKDSKGRSKDRNREGRSKYRDREGRSKDREREGRSNREREGRSSDREREGRSKDLEREGRSKDREREGRSNDREREGRSNDRQREGPSKDREREGRSKDLEREGRSKDREREGRSNDRERKGRSNDRQRDDPSKDREREGHSKDWEREGRLKDREREGHSKDWEREGRSKDREREGRSKHRDKRDFGRQTSGTSITVSEAARMGTGGSADKIFVADRGPAARVRPARIGSIEVVTASQFALLGKAVKQLEQITGPLPEPVLPDNETLRQDLAKGRASLQDTMQAVQLTARVQAAEHGVYRMAELLTQLAQSGMVPPEFAGQMEAIEEYLQPGGIRGTGSTASQMDEKKFTATVDSEFLHKAWVTRYDMHEVLDQMKEALFTEIDNLTAPAKYSADKASNTSRSVAEKLEIAMQVNGRITTLLQLTEDYAKQLGGMDFGIKTQVDSFQGQLVTMRSDLEAGLALLDAANNNAETAALLDLSEHHQSLVDELEHTVDLHQNLLIAQHQTSDEITSLLKCVEILGEQKADRDEVIDDLRDKADLSRLVGMLHEKDFAYARSEIENHISKCFEMSSRQDMKWREAISDLMAIADDKAEMIMLMALKDATNTELNAIQKLLHKLEIMLGEPKAAILMRKLAKDATCGACMTRALMQPEDATHGKPLPLPALRPPPLGAEQQACWWDLKLAPPDTRDHICHRWAGGSHTLMAGNIVKKQAKYTKLQIIPTKKFEGTGSDGRYYMMEEDMQPCAECNQLSTDKAALVSLQHPTPIASGDQVSAPTRRRKRQR